MKPYLACHTERDLKLMEPDLDIFICFQNILSQKMQISPKNSQKNIDIFLNILQKAALFSKTEVYPKILEKEGSMYLKVDFDNHGENNKNASD